MRDNSLDALRAVRLWYEGEAASAEPPGSGAFWAATLNTAALSDAAYGVLVDTDQWCVAGRRMNGILSAGALLLCSGCV